MHERDRCAALITCVRDAAAFLCSEAGGYINGEQTESLFRTEPHDRAEDVAGTDTDKKKEKRKKKKEKTKDKN
jgi:hypothetical protein